MTKARRYNDNNLRGNQLIGKDLRLWKLVRHGAAAMGIWLSAVSLGHADDTILHNFTGGPDDGYGPNGSLTLDGSQLFGMTYNGGSNVAPGTGTLFGMNTDGSGFSVLYSFPDGGTSGQNPRGSLTLSGSTLYGMTSQGGTGTGGTIFSIQTNGSGFSLLHSFTGSATDGSSPFGSLTLAGSKLYGMTMSGGTNSFGTIFSMNNDGTGFSVLHSFDLTDDGASPQGSLILVGSKLYGMSGGPGASGTIFSMNLDGSGFAVLHNFAGGPTDGQNPLGSLTLIGSTLYGTTNAGGAMGMGTLFSVGIDGSNFNLLHSFGGPTDGGNPDGSLTLSGSLLYGTTEVGSGPGTVFAIAPDGSDYQILDTFAGGPNDGAYPRGDVNVSADGTLLYGMTNGGGSVGDGTVFTVSTGVPEPGSWSLLGFAGTGLLALRRRQRR